MATTLPQILRCLRLFLKLPDLERLGAEFDPDTRSLTTSVTGLGYSAEVILLNSSPVILPSLLVSIFWKRLSPASLFFTVAVAANSARSIVPSLF